MSNRKRKNIARRLQELQKELAALPADPERQRHIVQAGKLIFCAEKILSKKDLIPFEKKAGEKY